MLSERGHLSLISACICLPWRNSGPDILIHRSPVATTAKPYNVLMVRRFRDKTLWWCSDGLPGFHQFRNAIERQAPAKTFPDTTSSTFPFWFWPAGLWRHRQITCLFRWQTARAGKTPSGQVIGLRCTIRGTIVAHSYRFQYRWFRELRRFWTITIDV